MYVYIEDGRVGILQKTNSHNKEGKYSVILKGDTQITHHHKVAECFQSAYDKYVPQPTKQPAKRGSKKS